MHSEQFLARFCIGFDQAAGARGDTPEQVEAALRQAGARIEAVVKPRLPVA